MFLQKLLLGLLSVGSVALPTTPQMVAQPPDDTDYLNRYAESNFTLGTGYFLNTANFADITFMGNSYRTALPGTETYLFSSTYYLGSSALSAFFSPYQSFSSLFDEIVVNLSLYSNFRDYYPGVQTFLDYQWHYRCWFHIKNSAKMSFNDETDYYVGIKYFNMIPADSGVSDVFNTSAFYYGDREDLKNNLSVSNLGFSGSNQVNCGSPNFALFPWSYSKDVWWSPIGTYVDVSGYDVHAGSLAWRLFSDGPDCYYNAIEDPLPVDSYVTKIHNAVMAGNVYYLRDLELFGTYGDNDLNTCHFSESVSSYIGSVPSFYFYYYNLILRNVETTMEVVPIWSIFSMILTMPFTFVFQAFNITLFQGTMYEFAVGPFVYSVFGIMILLGVFGLIFSFIRGK